MGVLTCVGAAAAGAFFYRQHRPLPGPGAEPAIPAVLSHLLPGPTDVLSQLPMDAPVIAYIDVAALRKLQGSPFAAILGLAGADPKEDRDYQTFVHDTGFDYTRDLDKVAIAAWPTSMVTPNSGIGKNQVMAIADGRFDQSKIKAYALRYGKAGIQWTARFYTVPGDPPVSFSFLSSTRIQLTDTPDMRIVSIAPTAAEKGAMKSRIDRVSGAPIFAVARTDNLPSSFYDNFRNSPQLASLARSVTALTLAGKPTGDRIQMTLDAQCNSMTNAIEIATLLDGFRMFGSVALADPKTRGKMTKEQAAFLIALANQVKVTHQDRWVRLSLEITPAMLGEAGAQANSNP
jgi:hypothetical protein